jgi:hypothetical protein
VANLIKRVNWVPTCYMTQAAAYSFMEQSQARQVGACCNVGSDAGRCCTLFRGHSGDHEAWGYSYTVLMEKWENKDEVSSH